MHPRDWTMLAIAASGRGLTPVQLQKSLFLFSENIKKAAPALGGHHTFSAYDYGPFSQAVYADADTLAMAGQVIVGRSANNPLRIYMATPTGMHAAATIRNGLPQEVSTYVDRVVAWVTSLSFNALVSAIYRDFPTMRANSVFRG